MQQSRQDWTLKQVSIAFGVIYLTTVIVGAIIIAIVVSNAKSNARHISASVDRQSCLRSNDVRLSRNEESRAIGLFVASDAHLRRTEAARAGTLSPLDIDTAIFWGQLVPRIVEPEPFLAQCLTPRVKAQEAAGRAAFKRELAPYHDTVNLLQAP